MRNTLLRRSLTSRVRQRLLFLLSLVCLSQASFAQPYVIPTANPALYNEYTYPTAGALAGVTNSHCYSRPGWFNCAPGAMPGGANVWLQVSSWEFAGVSGVAWQVTDWATQAIYDQGFMMLPCGVTDVNVGIITTGVTMQQVDVSYYLAGVGHFVDVYDWYCPTIWSGVAGGLVLNASNQLSCLPTYTRISMDSHLGYGTAVVWEDPTAGTNEIHVVGAQFNAFGPPQRIMGTAGHITPEVAFVHPPGPLEIHVASYDPATGNIEEYFFNWMNIIPGGANACPPPGLCNACPALLPRAAIVDINPVAAAPNSLHIDAPDHYLTQNWAYTYEIGGDVFARIKNPNVPPWLAPAMAGAATVCFTNGTYAAPFYPPCCPMPAINAAGGNYNTVPVICWDQQAQPVGMPAVMQQSFYVAWHTTKRDIVYNPNSDAYIAIHVNEDGLIRFPMPTPAMPFFWLGTTSTPANISGTPTVALSECNENQWMYTTYAEYTPSNSIQNRWVTWNLGSFKPGHTTVSSAEKVEVRINPNPFKDNLTIEFAHEMEGEVTFIKVTDMQGRELNKYTGVMFGASDFLSGVAKKLVPGNYNISVECSRIKYQNVFKVTKLD